MFEEYLKDAHEFQMMASSANKEGDTETARRCWRSAVFAANSAMEAYLNYLSDSFNQSKKLPDYEQAFISDKVLFFSVEKMEIVSRVEYHKTEDKLRFFIRKYKAEVDLRGASWSRFCQFKQFRDGLIHPRLPEDDIATKAYQKELNLGLQSVIELMNLLNQAIFRRPLRKKLLDLSPD